MSNMPPIPTPPPISGFSAGTPAGIGSRFTARIIDFLIGLALVIPGLIVFFILLAISDVLAVVLGGLLYLALIGISFYIFGWGLGETGQTPGKRNQGVMLVDSATGRPIGGGKGIGRFILEGVINQFCLINWIWALFDSRNQTIVDKILGAEVIEVPPGEIMPIFPNGKPF